MLLPYRTTWSEFEVQSLAFGILRKNLYPDYLVRGEYKFEHCRVDIAIWKPTPDKREADLICVVEVKKRANGNSKLQEAKYQQLLGVPVVFIQGGNDAYNAVELVKPYLVKS